MKTFTKVLITFLLSACILSISIGIYKCATGNYFRTASLITGSLLIFISVGTIVGLSVVIRNIWKLWTVAFVVITMNSCNYAKSNQQVVVSDDCGMSWKKINAGEAVPKGAMNNCYMKVVMPNYPMQGDSKFISNFKDRVRASVHIDYDYSITEPLAFIKQAKYLGKANTDADDQSALNPEAFEGAENMVIDKRIRDVSKGIMLQEDIVELEQAELENRLLSEANKILEPLGVHLNFITLTFDLDEQTRQAIDISTAMKIYESKGLSEIGKSVMSARAGAPKIVIENKIPSEQKPE